MKNIRIGLLPYNLKTNDYLKLNRIILSKLADVVDVPRPHKLLFLLINQIIRHRKSMLYDILIINWKENILSNSHNSLSLTGCIEFYLTLVLYKIVCRRLIYVRHNIHPHNLKHSHANFARSLINYGQSIADAVVVHSANYADEYNNYYVPHPLYKLKLQSLSTIPVSSYFLIFGRIDRYKNIHKLIELINNEDIELLILGPCNDRKYLAELEILALGKKIVFDIGFHEDNYLQERIASSRGVIIANDSSSMLVSGGFYYAITCGARIYTLCSPFMIWINQTSLRKYVFMKKNLQDLLQSVENAPIPSSSEREMIVAHAEELFGNRTVEKSWKKVLEI